MKEESTKKNDRPWFSSWPRGVTRNLDYPRVAMFETLETSARRYPDKTAVIYYDRKFATGSCGRNRWPWPAAVGNTLYRHPAIKEACVVRVPDERVGEEVKALIVLHDQFAGRVTADEIKAWAREKLAAYEYPRVIEFVTDLPKSSTGKILWKTLQ